jgi:hypothetical protein
MDLIGNILSFLGAKKRMYERLEELCAFGNFELIAKTPETVLENGWDS